MLISTIGEKMYTGYTNNLKLRFEKHQQGKINSTKDRRPLKLIYYSPSEMLQRSNHLKMIISQGKAYLNQQDAARREKYSPVESPIYRRKSLILFNRVKDTLWKNVYQEKAWKVVFTMQINHKCSNLISQGKSAFWLEFVIDERLLPNIKVSPLLNEASELTAIFFSSRKTAKK